MPLTRSFKETTKARIQRDPEYRAAVLEEATQVALDGDMNTAKAVLRDYINATIGFDELSKATDTPAKSLMRMFGPEGNPTVENFFAVLHVLQERTGVTLQVRASGN